jgi:hypothetical protein
MYAIQKDEHVAQINRKMSASNSCRCITNESKRQIEAYRFSICDGLDPVHRAEIYTAERLPAKTILLNHDILGI